jgi:AraC-like DNA-binding protein
MDIRVHIPATSQLTEYVTSIWEVFGRQHVNETILPQGVVEMIFNLGDPMDCLMPDKPEIFRVPLCFIQGVNTQAIQASYPGQQHLFGIRLQPGMVRSLIGIIPSELKNTLIDLTLIKPAFSRLWHELKEAASFPERVKVIEAEFPVLSAAVCHRTEKLCNLFLADGLKNFDSLETLSQQVYYSPRHLNRKSQSLFGISVEELITYKKFLHAVKLMHFENDSLTAIAHESGFFDQAHFCRTFKSYTGITAKQYRQKKSDLPFHLFSQAE